MNAGSSSLKLRVLADGDAVLGSADLAAPRGVADAAEIAEQVSSFGVVDAVGHRIVHGGRLYSGPVRVDADVRARLEGLVDLAPLHQPKSLAALDAVAALLGDVPAVACFDTAFHTTLPRAAATYALPAEWRQRFDLHRYGFHGLSHAYATRRAAELMGREAADVRLVTCHLGAGASLAAVAHGASVDTTMGFTPLDGLVMATRSGSVDPGLLMWLQEHVGMPPGTLASALEHRSGLAGLAGTPDMPTVITRAGQGDGPAKLALDVYLHRLRAGIASMVAAMGGLDGLVFTGGVGEHAAEVRAGAAEGLGFLGVAVAAGANEEGTGDRDVGARGAAARTLVVEAREDLQVAAEVRQVLGHPA